MYKYLHQTALKYFAELLNVSNIIVVFTQIQLLRTDLPSILPSESHLPTDLFSCFLLWTKARCNSLPEHIKTAASIHNFKKLSNIFSIWHVISICYSELFCFYELVCFYFHAFFVFSCSSVQFFGVLAWYRCQVVVVMISIDEVGIYCQC